VKPVQQIISKPFPVQASEAQVKKRFEREEFVYILSLVSLNGTFDRKTLQIPEYPSVLKLGRPNNTQRTPTIYNGYFDSRVISREHAEVYVKKGRVYINDLKSANGTFLNSESIHSEKELKVGDIFDLGIDISNDNKQQHQQQQHLKICCKVEGFLSFPIDGITDTDQLLANINKDFNRQEVEVEEDPTPKLNLFDAAMFGDVNSDLGDVELGLNHDYLTGMFVNNNIGTSSSLIQSIKLLIDQVHSTKLYNLKLASIETFLQDYKTHLDQGKGLLKLGEKEKAEIKNLETTISNLKDTLLKRENEIKQKELDSNQSETKIQELLNENEVLVKRQRDTYSKIETLKKVIQEQNSEIKSLEELQQEKSNDFETQLKSIKEELESKDELVGLLTKYKEESIKNEILVDMAKLSVIFAGVVVAGITTLYYF
jgi:hypothetical protein